MSIPIILQALSVASSAVKSITGWLKKSQGDSRSIIGELKDNLKYLDMVAVDGIALSEVVEKLSVAEYRRLGKEGFDFNNLKRSRIAKIASLKGTNLEKWAGKETTELVESIYAKINDIKIRSPHVGSNPKYRWGVRVSNIRKRIWLLIEHGTG